MNTKRAGLTFAIATFFLSTSAFATVVIDGVFDRSGEWLSNHTSEDFVREDGYLGPGWGGQAYDVEHLGTTFDSNTLYFGIQAGYNFANPPSSIWLPGDFALNVDHDAEYEYAIDFAITGSQVSYSLIDMTTAGTFWEMPFYAESGPWNAVYTETLATWTHDTAFGFGDYSEHHRDWESGTSYVLEGMLDLSLLQLYTGGDITLHWTMGCGNDSLEHTAAPVPEPATMLLFGTGLAGIASSIARRRMRNS